MENEPMIDYTEARQMFRNSKRSQRNFTIGSNTDTKWRKFIERYSQTEIRRGNGISSVMTEFAMKLTMAILIGASISETADMVKQIMPMWGVSKVKSNLKSLYDLL